MSVLARYEERAAAWDKGGRSPELLEIRPLEIHGMFCWCQSAGAEYYSDALMAYVNASIKAFDNSDRPKGLGNYLRERTYCEQCSARFMLCNLWLCTDCHALYCNECVMHFQKGQTGNRHHNCAAGELVSYDHPID